LNVKLKPFLTGIVPHWWSRKQQIDVNRQQYIFEKAVFQYILLLFASVFNNFAS